MASKILPTMRSEFTESHSSKASGALISKPCWRAMMAWTSATAGRLSFLVVGWYCNEVTASRGMFSPVNGKSSSMVVNGM